MHPFCRMPVQEVSTSKAALHVSRIECLRIDHANPTCRRRPSPRSLLSPHVTAVLPCVHDPVNIKPHFPKQMRAHHETRISLNIVAGSYEFAPSKVPPMALLKFTSMAFLRWAPDEYHLLRILVLNSVT